MFLAATIINGRPLLEPQTKEALNSFYKLNEGKTVYIHVDTKKPPRSLLQNAYYWLILGILADFTGDNTETIHNNFKTELLPRLFDEHGNEVEKSTTRLSTKEFTNYIEQVRAIAAEWEVILPDPI